MKRMITRVILEVPSDWDITKTAAYVTQQLLSSESEKSSLFVAEINEGLESIGAAYRKYRDALQYRALQVEAEQAIALRLESLERSEPHQVSAPDPEAGQKYWDARNALKPHDALAEADATAGREYKDEPDARCIQGDAGCFFPAVKAAVTDNLRSEITEAKARGTQSIRVQCVDCPGVNDVLCCRGVLCHL